MAISTPVSRAPVIRWRAMGWPPSSHTQMVSSAPISLALASAASSMMRASSSVSRLTVIISPVPPPSRSWHVDPDLVALDAHGVGRDGGAAGGQEALTGPHVVHPAMPGAGQSGPGQLPFTERAAAVRARVGTGIYLIPDAGQGQACSVHLGEHAAARGDLREGGRADLHARSARGGSAPHRSSFST